MLVANRKVVMPAKKPSKSEFESKIDEIVDKVSQAIKENNCHCKPNKCNPGNAIYGMGICGAIIFYFQHPPAGEWLWTIVKVIFWPAVVAYRLLAQFGL